VKKAWVQLLILLAVTFVFVPLVIENLLYRTLIGWGLSDIIAGNIAGVMIAAALLTAGYLTTRSDSKGSWKERVEVGKNGSAFAPSTAPTFPF